MNPTRSSLQALARPVALTLLVGLAGVWPADAARAQAPGHAVAAPASGSSGPTSGSALRVDDDDASRRQIEQKLQLTARMIGDSAFVQRIQASGSTLALTNYDEARVHHAAAADFLGRGDLISARRSVDDALRHIGLARRLAPDAPTRQAAARQRYDQLLASLERLGAAWRRRADAAATRPAADSDRLTAMQGLTAQAAHLAGEKRYDEASALLSQAERHVLEGMNSLMQSTTLDYSARPATPAEELEQELARHRGLADLVPLAISDLKPRPEAQALIERYNETSTTLRNQALQQQHSGDVVQALSHIRNATIYVQRALQAAGLVVPQVPGVPQ